MAKWTKKDYLYFLRKRLDEEDVDVYSTEELTTLLNEALLDLGTVLKRQEIGHLTLNNQSTVLFEEIFVDATNLTFPLDQRTHNFLQLRSVYVDNTKLPLLTPEEAEAGRDGVFLWGDTLNFNKPLTGELKIYYIRTPKLLLLDTDTSEIPEQFQHIPLDYAISRCRQKDGEYGQYDYDYNRYIQEKEEMKKHIQKQENQSGVYNLIISDYRE